MNKQAFAFLTLFTLILMLSIYYVTLPADHGQLNPDQILTSQPQPDEALDSMQQQLDDKHNAQTQDSESVVSSSGSTSQEKQDALQQVGQIQQNQEKEQAISQSLSDAGLAGCLTELDGEVVRIVCPKTLAGAESASKIMKIVASQTDEQTVPEVTFK